MSSKYQLLPPPGPPSHPPRWEDVERLAMFYPQVHAAVTLVERGDLTREQGLVTAVFMLAESYQLAFEDLVRRRERGQP